MKPILTVARHEWRRIWRDRALPLALAGFSLLMVVALVASVDRARGRLNDERVTTGEVQTGMAARRKAVEGADRTGAQPFGDIRRLNGVRQRPVLDTGPQGFLAAGSAETLPQRASFLPLMGRWSIFDDARADFDNPEVSALGRLDPAAVVVFLLPLLVLAVTCDAWVTEREIGTEALLFAQPIRRWDVWCGKVCIHAGLPVGGAAVVAGLLTIAGTRMLTGTWMSAAAGGAWVMGLTAAYGMVWALLGLWLSVRARSAERAIASGGIAWVLGVLVIPALAAAAVDAIEPMPSYGARLNAVREVTAKANAEGGTIAASRTDQLPPDAPASQRVARMWENTRGRLQEVAAGEQAAATAAEAYDRAIIRRASLARVARWVSPATLALDGFERLAGTDEDRALVFQHGALELHRQMRELLVEFSRTDHHMTRRDLERIPEWQSPPVIRGSVAISIALLWISAVGITWSTRRRVQGRG